jgi:hypothetical protein
MIDANGLSFKPFLRSGNGGSQSIGRIGNGDRMLR